MESLRNNRVDAKRTKLECYIANVNPECWSQYKASMPIDRIQPYVITNMISNACRALTLHIKNTCILWSHRSKLASLWTIKMIILSRRAN